MSTISPKQWQEVSPYLDQALAMPDEDRELWLAALREQSSGLAELLQSLLDEHRFLSRECFLERGAARPPGGAALAGLKIGAYVLVAPIGRGGMGTVWLAARSDGRFGTPGGREIS